MSVPQLDLAQLSDTERAALRPLLAIRATKSKVAIVGFTNHRKFIDGLGPEFSIWGLNELYRYIDFPRFEAWWEIHRRDELEKDEGIKDAQGTLVWPPTLDALRQAPVPVYMLQHWDDLPPSVPFRPVKDVIERAFPSGHYQTSTISWQIATAILLGFEEIHVYGVDMAQDTEYSEQRPCVEYWLGIAQGMGIRTVVPPEADLLHVVGQYGFGVEGDLFRTKLEERIGWLHDEDNKYLAGIRQLDGQYRDKKAKLETQYQQKRNELLAQRHQTLGAIQDCTFWKRSWSVQRNSGGFVDREGPDRDGKVTPSTATPPMALPPPIARRITAPTHVMVGQSKSDEGQG